MKGKKEAGVASAAAKKVVAAVKIEHERANFKALLLANPNHFGNMPGLGFPVVKALSQKTTYEELTCIGLHPQGNRLQAVVNVNYQVWVHKVGSLAAPTQLTNPFNIAVFR